MRGCIAVELKAADLLQKEDGSEEVYFASFITQTIVYKGFVDNDDNNHLVHFTTVLLQQKANKLVRMNKRITLCATNKVVLMGKEAMAIDEQVEGKNDGIFDLRFKDVINSNRLLFLFPSFWILFDECRRTVRDLWDALPSFGGTLRSAAQDQMFQIFTFYIC